MKYALGTLARNLWAGMRLAVFAPVSRLAFRVDTVQLLLLFGVLCLVDIGGDHLRYADAPFNLLGVGSELAGLALLCVMALLVALAVIGVPATALALAVTALASLPLVRAAYYALSLASAHDVTRHGLLATGLVAILAWHVAILVRVVALQVARPPRPRWIRASLGGLVLAVPLALAPLLVADIAWFRPDDIGGADGTLSAASEPVMVAQKALLDDALGSLEDRAPGAVNLYFVVYAPDGTDAAWNEHAEAIRTLVDDRLDTKGRSIVLRTHADTMLTTPFATVSNLRETLNEIAAAGDPEQDVLMLYVGGRSTTRAGAIAATLPPLDLMSLTPPGLRSLLDNAGIQWRIIIVSACHASAYADALDDDYTAVVAATDDGGNAAICASDGDTTAFGDALFTDGFAHTDSLVTAFAVAREHMARVERAQRLAPSRPLMRAGVRIEPLLRHLRRFGGGATALRSGALREAVFRSVRHR